MSILANLFGYVLNFLYTFVQNYGVAIILFTVLLRLILLPFTYKQQITMKKTAQVQEKLKKIQEKYKDNPEKLNQETLDLYKREKMNPCSGCFSAIIQIVIFLSVFYLVSSPLTYMKKVDAEVIENYKNEIKVDSEEQNAYYPEIDIIREKGATDEEININMEFLGLNLSSIPSSELNNPTVYIIPVLYVVSSIISLKLSSNMNINKKKDEENEEEVKKEKTEMDAVESMNKNMMLILPIMSVIIAMIAPLGLALYWLVNNLIMIFERLIITKIIKSKEEAGNA